jgi:hypothetical protein
VSRVPEQALRRSHADLFASLSAAARARFAGPPRGTWDPEREDVGVDLGRAVLDALALALHVLWTYQEAWTEESFLAPAQLDTSVDRLLSGVGYRASPGSAAVGLQHFRCRPGTTAVLPLGFAVRSDARGDELEATFETLAAIQLHPELNELRALWPNDAAATARARGALDVTAPPPGSIFNATPLTDALVDALQGQRAGQAAQRAAARSRRDALRYGEMLNVIQDAVDKDPSLNTDALRRALEPVCKLLCEAQRESAKAAPPKVADTPTESQEILTRQLRQLERRVPEAASDLDKAMARAKGESDADYAARLGAMGRFLDAFVAGLVQDARDQVALLHGTSALTRLDQAFAGEASALGAAKKGQDRLYLFVTGTVAGQMLPVPVLRPGDWLVVGEDVERIDPRGVVTAERVYRQAIRVMRVGQGRPTPKQPALTVVQFEPPLGKDYDLGRVVLLGNVAPISHGSAVEEAPTPGVDRLTIPLARGPLTWLRDPLAPRGRRPEVQLVVGKRGFRQVGTLLDPTLDDACFAVEPTVTGGVLLRTGDGFEGAALPDLPLALRYRVGLGATGNRAPLRIDSLASHPAIERTFNPLPTTGGVDAAPRSRARAQGPRVLAATDRAVSISDVKALALAFDGVSRAHAFLQGTPRRAVCVVVVAGLLGSELIDDDREALRRHLLARVPPGVRVTIENRKLVPVRAKLLLRVERGADAATLFRRARALLGVDADATRGLLHPDNIDLAADVRLSSVYGALADLRRVVSVVVHALHRDDGPTALHDRVLAGPRELLAWAKPTDGTEGVALSYEEVRG